jgi:DNA-binding transcriptional MocR family regulator
MALEFEERIRAGSLRPGERLPAVRALALERGVDPGTAAAAYRLLRERGFVISNGRRGTRVARQLEPRPGRRRELAADVRDLASSFVDPALLPDAGQALRAVAAGGIDVARYEENAKLDTLVEHARTELSAAGVDASALAFVGGTLDGIERVLQANLRPGDRVGVEDPGFPRLFDLLQALNLRPVPVPVDDDGLDPDALQQALARGLHALVITPHGQNPFGASLTAQRANALRHALAGADVLLVEDAHGWELDRPSETLTTGPDRWAVIRSVSRLLGPDLRLAFVAGDRQTIARVEARQAVTTSWVSRLLQEVAAGMLTGAGARRTLRGAAVETDKRRVALLSALERRDVGAHGASGLHAWIPVREEAFAVQQLRDAGYAVQAGERFRLRTPPAVRVTTALLPETEAEELADAIAEAAAGRSLIS